MIYTTDIKKIYRFGHQRDVTDEFIKDFQHLINNLQPLSEHSGDDEDWIKAMAYMGARGERLSYLDYLVPIPKGYALEGMLSIPSLVNLAEAYVLGFSSFTRFLHQDYTRYAKKLDILEEAEFVSKATLDHKKNKFKEAENYLKDIKSEYIKKSNNARSSAADLLKDDGGEF